MQYAAAVTYLRDLAVDGNPRGGNTLEQSCTLDATVKALDAHDLTLGAQSTHVTHVDCITACVARYQAAGVLQLKEAWCAYNAIELIQQHRDALVRDETDNLKENNGDRADQTRGPPEPLNN